MLSLIHNFESEGGAATQAGWRLTRARCGEKANFVCLLDLGRCALAAAKAFMMPALATGGDPAALAAAQKIQTESLKLFRAHEPSYSGVAVAFEPHTFRLRLYIPREQVHELLELYQLATDTFAPAVPPPKPPKSVPEE